MDTKNPIFFISIIAFILAFIKIVVNYEYIKKWFLKSICSEDPYDPEKEYKEAQRPTVPINQGTQSEMAYKKLCKHRDFHLMELVNIEARLKEMDNAVGLKPNFNCMKGCYEAKHFKDGYKPEIDKDIEPLSNTDLH